MAVTIQINSGESESPELVFDAPRIVLGRSASCDVRLPDASVSHRHASLRQRGSEYILLDENSTNGTFVGPVRLMSGAPRVVKSGDKLRLGRVSLTVEFKPAVPTAGSGQLTREIALALVAGAMKAGGETAAPRLRIVTGDDEGKELVLEQFDVPYTIGRYEGCDLAITDPDSSRRHLSITRRGTEVIVQDLNSKNGCRLDSTVLRPDLEYSLKPTQTLIIGQTHLAVIDPLEQALGELEAAPDEKLPAAPDELPSEAPVNDEAVSASIAADAPSLVSEQGVEAQIAQVPKGTAAASVAATNSSKSRDKTLDIAVALLAVVVLGASVAGIVWLIVG